MSKLRIALVAGLLVVSLSIGGCGGQEDSTSYERKPSATTAPASNPYFENRDYYPAEESLFAEISYFHDTLRGVGIWVLKDYYGDYGSIFVLPDSEYMNWSAQ